LKITWLGGSTFRLYAAGRIVVTDGGAAPGVDPAEVRAGADTLVTFATIEKDLPAIPPDWRPEGPRRPIDDTGPLEVGLYAIPGGGLLLDDRDGQVVIVAPPGVEWYPVSRATVARDAAVILFGEPGAVTGSAVAGLDSAHPGLLALALPDIADDQFARIAASAGRHTAVQVLEPGLAVEA